MLRLVLRRNTLLNILKCKRNTSKEIHTWFLEYFNFSEQFVNIWFGCIEGCHKKNKHRFRGWTTSAKYSRVHKKSHLYRPINGTWRMIWNFGTFWDSESLCGSGGPGFCYVPCDADCSDIQPTSSASRCQSVNACDVQGGIKLLAAPPSRTWGI